MRCPAVRTILVCLALGLICSGCWADSAYFQGLSWQCDDQIPTKVSFICANSYWGLTLYQKKVYVNGQLKPLLTARLIGSETAAGPVSWQRDNDLIQLMIGDFTGATVDKISGLYEWRLQAKDSSQHVLETQTYEFAIKQYAGNGSGSGGSMTSDDLKQLFGMPDDPANGTPGANASWWVRLVGPSSDKVNELKEELWSWRTWGPFGIWTAITNPLASNAYGASINHDHTWEIILPTPYGGMTMDLSPYEYWIRGARLLMSGGLWFVAIMMVWKRVVNAGTGTTAGGDAE